MSSHTSSAPTLSSTFRANFHPPPQKFAQLPREENTANMADDDSSELSSLSSLSAPPSEDESDIQLERREGILKFFHKTVDHNPELEERQSTPPRKREPSPPHEYVLADNPDIAVRVSSFYRVELPL
jgi:hypothetical protein